MVVWLKEEKQHFGRTLFPICECWIQVFAVPMTCPVHATLDDGRCYIIYSSTVITCGPKAELCFLIKQFLEAKKH